MRRSLTSIGGVRGMLHALTLKTASLLSGKASTSLARGLWFKSPRAYALTLARSSLLALAASLTLALLTYLYLLKSYLALLLLAAPLVVLGVGLYLPHASVRSRRTSVEAELPFFSVASSVMAVTGLSLIRAFELALRSKLFPAMSKEASLLRRNSLYFSGSPLEALEEVAREHPSSMFRQWILGYTSVLRSGGDVAAYLASKARDFLRGLERKWMSYANTTSVLGEAVLAVFLICPLSIALTSLVFAGGLSVKINQLYSLVVVPCITVASSALIHYAQPRSFDRYELSKPALTSLVVGAALLLALSALTSLQPHEALLASLLASSIPLAVCSHLQLSSALQAEKALPDFLRDVTEHVKLGFSVRDSILRLSRRSYGKHLDSLLSTMRSRLALGHPFEEAALSLKTPSWLVKAALLILAQLSESGGGRPVVLEMLTNYVGDYNAAKASGRAGVRLQAYVGYGAPAFMVAGVSMLKALAKQLASTSSPTPPAALALAPSYAAFLEVLPSVMLMTVITSFVIGIIVAKVSDLTFLSFKHPLVCLAVAAASMVVAPLLM
jgi:flagellar protein FlaJ